MARTNVAAQTLPITPGGNYPTLPIGAGLADITFAAADTVNGNSTVPVDGKTVVLAYNTDTVARTVTFTSAPDSYNRSGDITAYSIAAGKVACFGPFKTAGWLVGGVLEIDASNALLHLGVIQLP